MTLECMKYSVLFVLLRVTFQTFCKKTMTMGRISGPAFSSAVLKFSCGWTRMKWKLVVAIESDECIRDVIFAQWPMWLYNVTFRTTLFLETDKSVPWHFSKVEKTSKGARITIVAIFAMTFVELKSLSRQSIIFSTTGSLWHRCFFVQKWYFPDLYRGLTFR